MTTPSEYLAGLVVGTVDSVAPSVITVVLDTEAPRSTALNTGSPTPFPRINGYVLIPVQGGAVVGQIAWMGVERSAFPKRKGFQDFGLIDLPYPLRRLRLTPIGTVVAGRGPAGSSPKPEFRRGITEYPSVGDSVLVPTLDQLHAVVQSSGVDARLAIGTTPAGDGATISVDPNKLFGRHTAVLGNTGSGKSCTVAGLVRWSIEAAQTSSSEGVARTRFIVLDPNGEYQHAFEDLGKKARVFSVASDELRPDGAEAFSLPAWMWNAQEWSAFTSASPRVQQPVLTRAIRELRSGQLLDLSNDARAIRLARQNLAVLTEAVAKGPGHYGVWPGTENVGSILARMLDDFRAFRDLVAPDELADALKSTIDVTVKVCKARSYRKKDQSTGWRGFSDKDLNSVVTELRKISALGADRPRPPDLNDPDAPIPFNVDLLPSQILSAAERAEGGSVVHFVAHLATRIQHIASDSRIRRIIAPEDEISLQQWLSAILGDEDDECQVRVIDLSLVPSDVLHVIVAALSRLVFDALQRHRRETGRELPTVMVLEEAHSFVHEGADDPSGLPTPTQLCRRVFERVAREGRKFGLGMLLSSQRPSELSHTVLSQCNSFLLHRVVSERDQRFVHKLVPDLMVDLLADLPNLPARHAILLGIASQIPKLVLIRQLPESHRPRSENPRYWEVWTGMEERPVDWPGLASRWVDPQ